MFQVGEFSKIARVSKRLLQYYEEIGLFTPTTINELSGYRYYSVDQLSTLNRILVLKDLGFPLEKIKLMLDEQISKEEIKGMFKLKKMELEEKILDDQQRLHRIEARLEINHNDDELEEVVIKTIPKQHYLSLRKTFADYTEIEKTMTELLLKVSEVIKESNIQEFVAIFHSDSFGTENQDIEMGFVLKKSTKISITIMDDLVISLRDLPIAETMATTVMVGDPDSEFLPFGKIAKWIEKNNYYITGPYREIGFDIVDMDDLINAVIEIQVPVERRKKL